MNRREFFKTSAIALVVATVPSTSSSITTKPKPSLVDVDLKELPIVRINSAPNWNKNQEYYCGDIVFSNTSMYVAINNTQNFSPENSIDWEKI